MRLRQLLLLAFGTFLFSVSFLVHGCVWAFDEPLAGRVILKSDSDINVTNHETFTIENCISQLTGRLIAEQDAVIAIRNAALTLSPSGEDGISLVLRDRALLSIVNSTIVFNRTVGDCQIALDDHAQASIIDSVLTGWGYVIGRESSSVCVNNSQISNGVLGTHSPGVATFDSSSTVVIHSVVDGIYVWENSTAAIKGTNVGVVRTTYGESDSTAINVTDSHVGSIETSIGSALFHVHNSTVTYTAYFHSNATAWLEDSSIPRVRATGNSTVYLLNSSVGEISIEDNARVLVGWYWPVVGLVTVPHRWMWYLQAASLVAVLAGIVAVSYAVYLRKRANEE